MSHDAPILTRREAADLLRVTIRTLERWEDSGKLTPVRLSPGVIRYKRTDIDRLIEEGEPSHVEQGLVS